MPTRLVICVDGVDYQPGVEEDKPTSVYRIYSSIKNGECSSGRQEATIHQVALYYPSNGNAEDILSKDRLQIGNFYHDQIRNVYEKCCEMSGDQDEVVFFGFSRGAYVVRAVAGLLHRFGTLVGAGHASFATGYKKLVKEPGSNLTRTGAIDSLTLSSNSSNSSLLTASSADLRPAPRIKFIGVFDTIKATNEGCFDVSFTKSIQRFRHAVALHEDRKALAPQCLYPEDFDSTALESDSRSFVQALFVGSHGDMGGTSAKGGLALYPLNWMVTEALRCGVALDLQGSSLSHNGGRINDLLSVAFPKASDDKSAAKPSLVVSNGVEVVMHDLRPTHDHNGGSNQYVIRLQTRPGAIQLRKQRFPFDDNGFLRGYCDFAPQGTIVHPSVYLLLDEHINIALDTKEAKLQRYLEDWRERMLGKQNGLLNFGFWGDDNDADDDELDPGAIRVLVCGNTGVGKSTLINKIFGVEVTQSSDRTRGIHDVRQAITFDGRPDLIVHDSGGFEAGAETEFQAIEEFLKEKSNAIEIKDRLHVIWFCVELNSARTLQTATEKLFQAVSTYANDVPIVIVATKKDDLLDIEFNAKRKDLKRGKQPYDEELCDEYADQKLSERLEEVKHEMLSVAGGRLDAIVAVSQEDDESIAFLSKTTAQCFDMDKVRLLYIRAQISRIDLKVDLALAEVMRRYKTLAKAASGAAFMVGATTTHRKRAPQKACKAIMNCFGLLSVVTTMEVLKSNVWDGLGFDLLSALAEGINTMGVVGTVFTGGIPGWIVTGALSVPLVVPGTCRLFLKMTMDVIS